MKFSVSARRSLTNEHREQNFFCSPMLASSQRDCLTSEGHVAVEHQCDLSFYSSERRQNSVIEYENFFGFLDERVEYALVFLLSDGFGSDNVKGEDEPEKFGESSDGVRVLVLVEKILPGQFNTHVLHSDDGLDVVERHRRLVRVDGVVEHGEENDGQGHFDEDHVRVDLFVRSLSVDDRCRAVLRFNHLTKQLVVVQSEGVQ